MPQSTAGALLSPAAAPSFSGCLIAVFLAREQARSGGELAHNARHHMVKMQRQREADSGKNPPRPPIWEINPYCVAGPTSPPTFSSCLLPRNKARSGVEVAVKSANPLYRFGCLGSQDMKVGFL